MEPGHPYDNDDLDALRAKQRRLLHVIEGDPSLAYYEWTSPEGVDLRGDCLRREYAIRFVADILLEAHAEYLGVCERHQAIAEARRIINRVSGDGSIDGAVGRLLHRLVTETPTADHDRTRQLREVALLLQVADVLAASAS